MKKFLSVLLAVSMILSTVSFAIPTAVTVADSTDVSALAEEYVSVPEEKAVLAADDTWYDIEKGTLLFNMDFESDNSGSAVSASAYDAISLGSYSAGAGELVSGLGRLNPDVAGNYDMGFRYTQSGSATVAEENGNKYFSVNSSASNQFSLYLGNTFTKAGKYVLEYDYKVVSSAEPNYIQYNTPSNGNDTGFKFGEWASSTSAYELTGASNAARVIFYARSNYASTDTLMLDNIKVWYYDESVDYEEILNPDIETNDVWEDEELGQKLFTIDFTAKDNKKALDALSWDTILNRLDNNPATGELISDLGRINPDVDGSNYRLSINYIDNTKTELVTDGDNSYLAIAPDSTKGDVSLYLGGIYGEDGTYVIKTSYKFAQTGENAVSQIRYETLGAYYKDAAYISSGEWVDLAETHEHASCTHGNVNRLRICTPDYSNTPYAENDRIYLDNIEVFYKAPVVEEPDDGGDEGEVASEWDNTEKGYRVFLADFETKNDGTAVISTDVSAITNGRVDSTPASGGIAATSAARVNPEYSSIARLNVKGGAGATIAGTADNQYLTLTSAGDSLILSQLYVGDGTYIIEFDANSTKIPEVRGSYSAGTVPTTEAIDGTWTHYTLVSENVTEASSKSCSSYHTDNIRFYFGTAPSMYDNIVVYYQPTGWTAPGEGDEGEDEPEVNEWVDNNHGIKLFTIDLDGDTKYQTAALANLNNRIDGANDNVASNGLYLSAIGRTNPEYASYENTFKYSFKDGLTPTVEGTTDKYFKHTTSANASVMVANPFVGEGTYTLVFNHSAGIDFGMHSGYKGGTLTKTAIDSTWEQTVYTIDISAQGSDDYFRMYSSTAPGTFLIDDVALFYKPEGWTPPSSGDDDDDETEDDVWTDENGRTKLLVIDFESKNDGTALDATSYDSIKNRLDNSPNGGELVTDIGRVNPDVADASSYRFSINYIDNTKTAIVTEDGNKSLEIASEASKGDISIYLGGIYDAEGKYEFEISYKFVQKGENGIARIRYETLSIEKNDAASLSTGEWVDLSLGHNHYTLDTHADVHRTRICTDGYANTPYSVDDRIYLDNIAVYYTAPETPDEPDAEIEWNHDEYGKLLFDANFEGPLSEGEQTRWAPITGFGAMVNPDHPLKDHFKSMWGTEDIGGATWTPATSSLIVSEGNNRYYTQPHAQTYNEFAFYVPYGGDYAIWEEPGIFTITYDVKISGDIDVANHFVDPNLAKDYATTNVNIRLESKEKANKTDWITLTYQVDVTDYTEDPKESLGKLIIYTQTTQSSKVDNAYICYDNIRVYWKPSKVDVTLNPGTNLEVNETVVPVSTNGALVSDILALVNTEDTTLIAKGISKNADGSEMLGLSDKLYTIEEATYYIIWEENVWMDNERGMLIMDGNFEGEFQTTGINRWPAIAALGATRNPDYNFDGVTGLQYTVSSTGIALDESGMWIPADYKRTEGNNTYMTYPIGKSSYSGEGYTNFNAYAMGKGASQYQYQGAGIYTISAKVRFPETLDVIRARISANAYNGNGGIVSAAHQDHVDVTAGEWNEISLTWSTETTAEYGLGSAEIYLFYELTDEKIYVDIDDIKIYYKPFTANITLRANNNPIAKDIVVENVPTSGISVDELLSKIRNPLGGMDLVGLAYDKAGTNMLEGNIVIGNDARFFMIWKESELDASAPVSENVNSIRTDDPIGMRFRSYVTTTVFEEATTVGWVVTRLDMLEAKSINPYDFYLESDVTKVYAYNKAPGAQDKVFGTDDINTYITAVLYNIPEQHYATTLVARPFTVVNGETFYGFPIERSICEVAEAIRDGGYAGCSNDQKAYIMSILSASGKPTEPQA